MKRIIAIVSLFICFMMVVTACSEKQNDEVNANPDEPAGTVDEMDKLMMDAENQLITNNLEKAKELYEEAIELDESDELHNKINNLNELLPIEEEALFDYRINNRGKDYQVLIFADDYEHIEPSQEEGAGWECAAEGEDVYEGNYSIYVRELNKTTFKEHYLGEVFLNKAMDPVQTINFDEGELLVVSQCLDSLVYSVNLFDFDGGEVEPVMIDSDAGKEEELIITGNKIKDYNPSENKFQTIDYSRQDGTRIINNYVYNHEAKEMIYEDSFELDDELVEEELDKWYEHGNDFYFGINDEGSSDDEEQKYLYHLAREYIYDIFTNPDVAEDKSFPDDLGYYVDYFKQLDVGLYEFQTEEGQFKLELNPLEQDDEAMANLFGRETAWSVYDADDQRILISDNLPENEE